MRKVSAQFQIARTAVSWLFYTALMDTIVQRVAGWFSENVSSLLQSFEILRFHVMLAADPIQGKVSIEVGRPTLVGSVSFWNKGDVTAMAVDKIHKTEHLLDDRILSANDDISVLLRSYCDRFQKIGG